MPLDPGVLDDSFIERIISKTPNSATANNNNISNNIHYQINYHIKARRDTNIISFGDGLSQPFEGLRLSDQMLRRLVLSDRPDSDAVDDVLDTQIDAYRDLINDGKAQTALDLLGALLGRLSVQASARIVARIKANIAFCHLHLGDETEACRWFDEAYEAAPEQPKIQANRALALILGNEAAKALEFCRERLKERPDNEHVAAYLLHAAAQVEDAEDPWDAIPPALREREEVVLGRISFLRARGRQAEWWDLARRMAKRFPANDPMTLLAAESFVDEVVRDAAFQSMRRLPPGTRERLLESAEALEAQWTRFCGSETPRRENGVAALAVAMVARQFVGDFTRATELSGHLIEVTNDEQFLLNAVQVALHSGDHAKVLAAADKFRDQRLAEFFRGAVHVERGEWDDAAACFRRADVPEPEREVARTVCALAPAIAAARQGDPTAFESALEEAAGDARSLILVAQEAAKLAIDDTALKAYTAARALIGPDGSLVERSMVAAFAASRHDETAVIDFLDGYVDKDRPSKELAWLINAHTNEDPVRRRNMEFFRSLPKEVRESPQFAGLYGWFLSRNGDPAGAERVFRSLLDVEPGNVSLLLNMVDALRRQKKIDEATSFIRSADEGAMIGDPTHLMRLAYELRDAGEHHRAIPFAYGLVRKNPEIAKVALGYVFLVLGGRENRLIPDVDRVGDGVWVRLTSETGETAEFTIDDGPSFFGIEVRSAMHAMARKILSLGVGEHVDIDRDPLPPQRWTVADIKSKYLRLLHAIMNGFETAFPDSLGLWRVAMPEGDVSKVFDFVRKSSEANQQRAKLYTEKRLPLAFVAQLMGTDTPSLATFVRRLGSPIFTCTGTGPELASASAIIADARGKGAVLDLLTVWVASELGILEVLKAWFGRLLVPQSEVRFIDVMIWRDEDSLGREMMTLSWHQGAFYREEMDEDSIRRQIEALRAIKEDVTAHCEIIQPVFPDHLPETASRILEDFGKNVLDPAYLALAERMVLLSDDLPYREMAKQIVGVEGLWLQSVLTAALASGVADQARIADACVGLAARKHDHVRLDPRTLLAIYDKSAFPEMHEFEAVAEFIGVANADMVSHTFVILQFFDDMWMTSKNEVKARRATSILLDKLLRFRSRDWALWFAVLAGWPNEQIRRHLFDWLRGHFLPRSLVNQALSALQQAHLNRVLSALPK